LFIRFSH